MSGGGGDWLPAAGLTAAGLPLLLPNEVLRYTLPSADLEAEETNLLAIKSGVMSLTTHRLIHLHEPSRSARSLPLSSIIHVFPPRKSLKTLFSPQKIRIQVSMQSVDMITVVVKSRREAEEFYGKLSEVLRERVWERDALVDSRSQSASGSGLGFGSGSISGNLGGGGRDSMVRTPVVGVAGILRKEQEIWENTDKSLQDAFQDLNALMSKAKEMVLLAEKMRQKLLSGPSSQTHTDDDDMGSKQEMQEWLLSVGIVSPITKESAGALYHQQLARQLADFVKVPLEKAGGMIQLIDMYCLFNRARGTELISPEDMLQACAVWEKINVPVMLRKFDSGVMVIQNKAHSDEEVFARIRSLAQKPDALRSGISPSDASLTLGIAPALAKEHMLTAESRGLLCRDVSPDGFRFYINLFNEIDLRSIHSVPSGGHFGSWVSATSTAIRT